ncbi:unnamed protein product [Linum tenue]|uniref:BZIP domain-containing protein n=1 Tax=Linum tenue TaxID=586396 RepID=A0AAV0P3L6_9ROSI|nr:unnamed protein product [Linum tenue]
MGTNSNFRNFTNDFVSSSDSGRHQQQQQPMTPLNFPLARQSSIYSLTFDEFQSTVGVPGKDFGSMNMDELLKNIWSAEENQNQNMAAAAAAAAGALPVHDGLQRQGSLTLPRTLSQKTVDEVWKVIWKEYGTGTDAGASEVVPQRQQTLGEMTLEEFLVRAGVVREDNYSTTQVAVGGKVQQSNGGGAGGFFGDLSRQGNNNNTNNGFGMVGLISTNGNTNPIPMQSASNLHLNVNVNGGVRSNQVQSQVQQQQPSPQIFPKQANNVGGYGLSLQGIGGANGLMQGGMVSPASQISSDGIGKSNGDTSSVSPVPYVFNGNMRGRRPNTAVEKVVERRQRRMIKNRESAARSRARKQAYTMELEAEIAKLKEENEELKRKQEEIMEVQKNQVMENMSMENGAGKRRCLRRTQTGPW